MTELKLQEGFIFNGLRVFLMTWMVIMVGQQATGQCIIDSLNGERITIPSDRADTISLRLLVENAAFDNLDLAQQGLCQVRLNFQHTLVSDLLISLTSPSGDQIDLIGQATGNGQNSTAPFPVLHDIKFVPGDSVALSDPGFPNRWTNANINWGVFPPPPYNGFYYPNMGDLEDFSGPVNGIWELTIHDEFLNDGGRINEFELIFCNTDSLTCSSCEALGGTFSQTRDTICLGLDYDVRSIFSSTQTDTAMYLEEYLVYKQGVLVQIDTLPDFSVFVNPEDTGNYEIYVLNVLRSQRDSLLSEPFLQDLNLLKMEDDKSGGKYCIELSPPFNLFINQFQIFFDQRVLCNNSSFNYRGQIIDAVGTYLIANSACDSIFSLDVVSSNLKARIVGDTVFTCNNTSMELSGEMSDFKGGDLFNWQDSLGNFISSQVKATVTGPGMYTLIIEDGVDGCTDTTHHTIIGEQDFTSVSVISFLDTLNCANPTTKAYAVIELFPGSNTSTILSWAGNVNNLFNDTVEVFGGGIISVELSTFSGCEGIDSILIVQDTLIPEIFPDVDTLSCLLTDLPLDFSESFAAPAAFEWRDPSNQLFSTQKHPSVSQAGTYELTATYPNTCTSVTNFNIPVDTVGPTIDSLDQQYSLSCTETMYLLEPFFDEEQTSAFYWLNDQNDTLGFESSLEVTTTGNFRFEAIGLNGCPGDVSTEVLIDTISPVFSIGSDTITCSTTVVDLEVIPAEAGHQYLWQGNGVDGMTTPVVQADSAGTYYLNITDSQNGCVAIDSVEVQSDLTTPDLNVIADEEIDCGDPNSTINLLTNAGNSTFWVNEQNDTVETSLINVSSAGVFNFYALSSNGCTTNGSVTVSEDFEVPDVSVDSVFVLTCTTPEKDLSVSGMQGLIGIEWIFTSGDRLQDAAISVDNEFLDRVEVTGQNGCVRIIPFDITVDQAEPFASLTAGEISCDNPTTQISVIQMDPDYTYLWDGESLTGFTGPAALISRGGQYSVTVTDTINGCMNLGSLTVSENNDIPGLQLGDEVVLSCNQPTGVLEASSELGNNIIWTFPDGSSLDTNFLDINEVGIYHLDIFGQNGCVRKDSVEVRGDFAIPPILIDSFYRLDCENREFGLSIPSDSVVSSVAWIFNGSAVFNGSDILLTDSSLNRVIVTGTNGCVHSQNINVQLDTIAPDVGLVGDTISCLLSTVDISVEMPDPAIEYTWSGGALQGLVGSAQSVAQGGTYGVTAVNSTNSCSDSTSIEIIQNDDLPIFDIVSDSLIDCTNPIGQLVVNSMENLAVEWTLPDGNVIAGPDIQVMMSGTYTYAIISENGCEVDGAVMLDEDFVEPIISLQSDYEISCANPSYLLDLSGDPSYALVEWVLGDGDRDSSLSWVLEDNRLSVVEVRGTNGCKSALTFNITLDTITPDVVITQDMPSCETQSIGLTTNIDPNLYSLSWTLNGQEVASDIAEVTAETSGFYVLNVLDPSNGCASLDSVSVNLITIPLGAFNVQSTDESCRGLDNGTLVLNGISGGVGEIMYDLNSVDIETGIEDNLSPGGYVLSAEDELGCVRDTAIVISEGVDFQIVIGDDLLVPLGTPLLISANATGAEVGTIDWLVNNQLAEMDILDFDLIANENVLITAHANSPEGCIASDSLFVNVFIEGQKVSMYVPDILYLGSQLGNNELRLRIPEDALGLDFFKLYDRWGELITEISNVSSDQNIFVWDGRLNGRFVQSGVYVFIYQLTTTSGSKSTITGHITVLN